MELRIEKYQPPGQISFNFAELKAELIQKASVYETMVYTDGQIQAAKTDRANLNRLKKALNDERSRREKEYMAEFNVFKAQIKELVEIIDKAVANSDKQIKAVEEQKKAEKMAQIESYWNTVKLPVEINLGQIFDEKWLNASVSMKSIQDAIDARIQQIAKDLVVVRNLLFYAFEAEQMYLTTLDLGKAVSESNRLREMAERKAAYEASQKKPEPEKTPVTDETENESTETLKSWVEFAALLSIEDSLALKQFFNDRNIEFHAI